MKVKDLKPKTGKVDITLQITQKSEPKEFSKFGSTGKVCNAKAKDETGEISVTLWNEQIDLVKIGDKVQIINGYVSEYQGEMQLSTGKFGQLKVLGKGELPEAKEEPGEEGENEEESEEDSEEGPEGEYEGTDYESDEGTEGPGNFDEEFIE